MKKAFLVFGILFFSLNICSGQTTLVNKNLVRDVDRLKKQFVKYFKALDRKAVKNNMNNDTDVIYCCQSAINFMADKTDIEPGTIGNRLGYPGFTKASLKQWHEWYDKKYRKKK
jgi:hypothetical protein